MRTLLLALIAPIIACVTLSVAAQDNPDEGLPWQRGPTVVQMGSHAAMDLPEGFKFLDPDGARELNVLMQNPPVGTDEYAIADASGKWVAFFAYEETGYIKDDEKIDPDDILESIRRGTVQSNKERRDRGWDELNILGWSAQPEYDDQIKSLAWSILAEEASTHEKVVNYNTRLLGRYGVMDVVVVTAPEELAYAIENFKRTVPGFQFSAGETYGEYQPGDHVAAYGLAALITGGAAAVAAKKGLFAVIGGFLLAAWKIVLAGLVAAGAWFKSLFSKKR